MIEINAVKKRIIHRFKIEISDLIRSFFRGKIGIRGNLCTKLVLRRKGDLSLEFTVVYQGEERIFGSRGEFFEFVTEGLKFFFFRKRAREEGFPFVLELC